MSVLSPESAGFLGKTLLEKWRLLPAKRKALLELLSGFNVLPTHAAFLYAPVRTEPGIRCRDF